MDRLAENINGVIEICHYATSLALLIQDGNVEVTVPRLSRRTPYYFLRGLCADQKPIGIWVFFYGDKYLEKPHPNQPMLEIIFNRKGEPHGMIKTYFENGLSQCIMNCRDGKLDGEIVVWSREPHEKVIVGQYEDGDTKGTWTLKEKETGLVRVLENFTNQENADAEKFHRLH